MFPVSSSNGHGPTASPSTAELMRGLRQLVPRKTDAREAWREDFDEVLVSMVDRVSLWQGECSSTGGRNMLVASLEWTIGVLKAHWRFLLPHQGNSRTPTDSFNVQSTDDDTT